MGIKDKMNKEEFKSTYKLDSSELKKLVKEHKVSRQKDETSDTTRSTTYSWKDPKYEKELKEAKGGNSMDLNYVFSLESELKMKLKPGQSIISNGGSMSSMREGVDKGELSDSGIFSGIGRMFSGQSVFMVRYTGLPQGDTSIAFSSPFPGDILHLVVNPEEEVQMSRSSFLACSPNMQISGKMNWKGIIDFGQDEGALLPKAINTSSQPGHVWLSTYGKYVKHELKEGQTLLVDNGLFLGSVTSGEKEKEKDKSLYELVNLGKTMTSTIFGSEGIGMKFSGPRVIYTQSHDFNALAAEIARIIQK
jgi:uncharacterized protein (AIM24 family)